MALVLHCSDKYRCHRRKAVCQWDQLRRRSSSTLFEAVLLVVQCNVWWVLIAFAKVVKMPQPSRLLRVIVHGAVTKA
ncbi:hypothetical protein, partial [Pseudomonas aeruginosa]|uniref:hypothetical protein n=1 Tax=Pseudomonas aeruginosa TaxID=287 RepID=UPI00345A19DE